MTKPAHESVLLLALPPDGRLGPVEARSLLLTWIFARAEGGTLRLRLPEEGPSREALPEALDWLGISHQGEPVDPRQRGARYLERLGEAAAGPGAERHASCLRLPGGRTECQDLVRGRRESVDLEPFDIRRPDGRPTEEFALACDAADLGVTHLLEAESPVATARRQRLFEALGAPAPRVGRLPRPGGLEEEEPPGLLEYREAGVLPEAMAFWLLESCWAAPSDPAEFTRRFRLEDLAGERAPLDPDALLEENGRLLAGFGLEGLADRCRPLLEEQLCWREEYRRGGKRRAWFRDLLGWAREGAGTLWDVVGEARPFLLEQVSYEAEAVRRYLVEDPAAVAANMREIRNAFEGLESWDRAGAAAALREAARRREVPEEEMAGPLRVGLTGRTAGPDLFLAVALHGRERVLGHLDALVRFLEHDPDARQAERMGSGLIPL